VSNQESIARGPVSRVLSRGRYPFGPAREGSHSSRPCVAARLQQPTRASRDETSLPFQARDPYLALLRVGFAVRALLPAPRCALTAPFQPYLPKQAVYSLWHFPYGCPRRALPATLVSWSPDFPRAVSHTRLPGPLAIPYLALPWSRSKSRRKRIARTCPSTLPSIFSGRQRRWNASTALCPSVTS